MKKTILTLLSLTVCLGARAELPNEILLNEAELIKVIQKADSPENDIVTACQNLGWCGTQAAVAPLAALLNSDKPHLRHAARYGLEMIPLPTVEAALCDAAGRLTGAALAGVLQSLGNCGGARAVAVLAKNVTSDDKAIASAAAQALGKLALPEAMAALKPGLGKCPCAADAYLTGAGKVAAKDPAKAAAYYADIRAAKENVTPATRLAALHGEIITAGDAGMKLWETAIASTDGGTVDTALRAVLDAQPGNRETLTFSKALANVPVVQSRLATVLGQRGDTFAVGALAALAKGEKAADMSARLSAAAALAALSAPEAITPLMALAKDADKAVSEAAKNELMGFSGKAADDAVIRMMDDPDAAARLAGIDMALRRRMAVAVPSLVKLTADADAKIIDAAVKGLGDLGTDKEIPSLLTVIKKNPKSETAVRALSALCARYARPRGGKTVIKSAIYGSFEHNLVKDVTENTQKLVDAGSITIQATGRLCRWDGFSEDPAPGKVKTLRLVYTFDGVEKNAAVRENDAYHLSGVTLLPVALDPIQAAYKAAGGEEKAALFKVLANLENDQALAIARDAAKQTADAALQETAIRSLIDWKTPAALEDAAAFAQNAPNDRLKILALRGFVRQLELAFTIPNADKVPRLEKASAWAVRDEDKALVAAALKAVGGLVSEEGFTPIFNGTSLAGWKGGGGYFTVKDGLLEGQTFEGKTPDKTSHLIWTGGQPKDYDLRLDFKLSPHANSGVQVRSKDQEFGDNAYQADMNGGGNYVGFLYHPRQHLVGERGKKVTFKAGDEPKKPSAVEDLPDFKGMSQKQIQDKLFMADVWNEMRLVVKGQTVTIYINGMKAQETTDPREEFLPPGGVITLQVHPGPPMKAQFRNLRIKEL